MAKLFFVPNAVLIDSTGEPYAGALANFYLTGTTTRTDTYSDSGLTTPHANPVVANSAGQFDPIYLDPDITYRCVLTQSDATQIADVDPVAAPIGAADITVADAGGYFAGSTVEAVLQDVGANYANLSQTETWTATQTLSGANWQFADNSILRPVLQDFGIEHNSVSSSSNAITLDLTTGNSFATTLTENISTVTLSNPPASGTFGQLTWIITQDGAGGAYTVTFPASVTWPGGTAPTISTGNNAVDVVTLFTTDGGTTWRGNFSQAFA